MRLYIDRTVTKFEIDEVNLTKLLKNDFLCGIMIMDENDGRRHIHMTSAPDHNNNLSGDI